MVGSIVDVDDVGTWPDEVLAFIDAELSTRGDHDSWVEGEHESLAELLQATRLLAFHHTRLLPAELEDISVNGLMLTGDALVRRKLDWAVRAHAITADEARILDQSAVHRDPSRWGRRSDQVCLSVGKAVFADRGAFRLLVENWGGETIYWPHIHRQVPDSAAALARRLSSIGEPCRLTVAYEMSGQECALGLLQAFLRERSTGRNDGTDLFVRRPIRPDEILGIGKLP